MSGEPDGNDEHPRRWLILAVLCTSLTIIIVDETVLNVAIPSLFRELHATSTEVQWAIDAYVLVYAALLFPAGNLGDRYGRRTFLVLGLVIFGGASMVAAWAATPGILIGSRAVMAVGGALIMPQTLSILVEVFSDHQRGMAISVWSSISGLGILFGPIMGGWLIEHFWWGSVFLVNLPVVLVAILGTVVLLPNHRDRSSSPVDLPGSILAMTFLLSALYAIIEMPRRGLTDPVILLTGIGGIVAGYAFVVVELRSSKPMFDVRVLRQPVVAVSCVVIVTVFLTLLGSAYVLTQYLQLIQERGALMTGLLYAPTTIGWSTAALASTFVTRKFGHRRVLGIGLVVLAATYVALATLGDSSALALVITAFTIQGIVMGLLITPVTDLIMGALPAARSGVASALNDAARQVGGAVGVAVLGSIMVAGFDRSMSTASGTHARVDNLARALDSGNPALVQAGRDAFIAGYRWVMVGCVVVLMAGAIIVWIVQFDEGTRVSVEDASAV